MYCCDVFVRHVVVQRVPTHHYVTSYNLSWALHLRCIPIWKRCINSTCVTQMMHTLSVSLQNILAIHPSFSPLSTFGHVTSRQCVVSYSIVSCPDFHVFTLSYFHPLTLHIHTLHCHILVFIKQTFADPEVASVLDNALLLNDVYMPPCSRCETNLHFAKLFVIRNNNPLLLAQVYAFACIF